MTTTEQHEILAMNIFCIKIEYSFQFGKKNSHNSELIESIVSNCILRDCKQNNEDFLFLFLKIIRNFPIYNDNAIRMCIACIDTINEHRDIFAFGTTCVLFGAFNLETEHQNNVLSNEFTSWN